MASNMEVWIKQRCGIDFLYAEENITSGLSLTLAEYL